jgi:hypothetical protein
MKKLKLKKEQEFITSDELKIAYNRLDHDGYRWWPKWFPCNGPKGNQDVIHEMEELSNYLTQVSMPNGLPDMRAIIDAFNLKDLGQREYNLFYEGEYINAWIRLIDRKRDYNMYIHCYEKKEG